MPLPTVILPGYFASALEYQNLEQSLQASGYPAVTVPLIQRDWFPTLGGRSMVPILRKIDQTVKQQLEQHNTSKINLIGHSAGIIVHRRAADKNRNSVSVFVMEIDIHLT